MASISTFARNFAKGKNGQHSNFRNEFREFLVYANVSVNAMRAALAHVGDGWAVVTPPAQQLHGVVINVGAVESGGRGSKREAARKLACKFRQEVMCHADGFRRELRRCGETKWSSLPRPRRRNAARLPFWTTFT